MKLSKTKIKTNLVILNIQHFQQKVNSFREKNKKTNNNKQQIAEKRIELSTFWGIEQDLKIIKKAPSH